MLEITIKAEELELDNKECRDRLTEQEQTLEVLQKEKRKTMEALRDLETQLEQEEQAKQKMVLDKNNSDTRNKSLAEKIVELQVSWKSPIAIQLLARLSMPI